jgi:hypothetical protein
MTWGVVEKSFRVGLIQAHVATDYWVILTKGRNSSLKPALRGFFSLSGTVGAAAAAAAARVGNPDRDVGCLAAAVDTTVAVADADDGSFVVDDVSSLRLIRGCL